MSLAALLAERHRRAQEAQATQEQLERYATLAAELRGWFSDKQREFFAPVPKARKATLKTRRCGATSGGVREFLARALTQPGWRGRYVNEIREEAKGLVWRADTKQGFYDILERLADDGKITLAEDRRELRAGADVKIDEQALTIDFRNGSQIRIVAADDQKSQERGRGGAPHCLWVDEAQKYPLLENFIESIYGPSMLEHGGETWLTGTPSEWCDGYFFDVTRDDDPMLRAAGWDVLEWSVLDNPFFGATREERFNNVIREVILKKKPHGWAGTDDEWIAQFLAAPPAWFQREWQAKWVKTDARFVYTVHNWPSPTYAPLRETTADLPLFLRLVNPEGGDPSALSGHVDRWYDHAAARRDLPQYVPGTQTTIDWFFGLGLDFGYRPDPFALVLWGFSPMMPGLYEMWSWKRSLVLPDYQREIVHWFLRNVPGLVYVDGDPGGLQGAHMEGWRELLGFPVEDAQKSGKRTWQEMLNNDGERGRIHMRDGSPYLHEMKHLTWVQRGQRWVENADRRLADGTVPGNHCSDGGLYSYRRYISRNLEEQKPPVMPGSPEWYAEEERKIREAAMRASRDAIAEERGVAGVEEWTY